MGTVICTDALIIGGGITARRAAKIIAQKHGVVLVSSGCGASPYIHGLNVPLLDKDSEELFYADTMRSGKEQNDPALASLLTKGAADVAREFADAFDRNADGTYDLLKPLGSSVPRVASIGGRTGAKVLAELCREKNYMELSDTRALSLIRENGAVVGAMLYESASRRHFPVFARAVLIAAGGFGGIFRFSTNSADIGGDAIGMAYEAGAELVDMEFIQYEPTVAVSPAPLIGKSIITTMLFEGAVMRNARGERFMDEKVGKDALSLGIYKEILNGGATASGGVYYDMTAVDESLLTGKYRDYFKRYKTHGIDIRTQAVEIAPAPHTTMGGIRIDCACRTTVDGLFAAGESAGGVHGANRLGGNAGLEVFVFGDAAGHSVSDYLDEKAGTDIRYPIEAYTEYADEPLDLSEEREALLCALDASLGVIKCAQSLDAAFARVSQIAETVRQHPHSYSAIRLKNDALTALLVITAAKERTENVGSHTRSDAAESAQEKYRILLHKDGGSIAAEKEKLL